MSKGRKPEKQPISKKVQVLLNTSAPPRRERLWKTVPDRLRRQQVGPELLRGPEETSQPLGCVDPGSPAAAATPNRSRSWRKLSRSRRRRPSRRSGTEPFDHVWCVIDGDYGEKIPAGTGQGEAKWIRTGHLYAVLRVLDIASFRGIRQIDYGLRWRHTQPKKTAPGRIIRRASVIFRPSFCISMLPAERAERLRKPGISRGDLPEIQNPCSEIYRLIDAILDSRDGSSRRIPGTSR